MRFPGLSPFRVTDGSASSFLILSLHHRARPPRPAIQTTREDLHTRGRAVNMRKRGPRLNDTATDTALRRGEEGAARFPAVIQARTTTRSDRLAPPLAADTGSHHHLPQRPSHDAHVAVSIDKHIKGPAVRDSHRYYRWAAKAVRVDCHVAVCLPLPPSFSSSSPRIRLPPSVHSVHSLHACRRVLPSAAIIRPRKCCYAKIPKIDR